jgi:hypothetical protein
MAASVGVNKLSVVTADTNGTTIAFPDVCKTPSPGGPIPIPYPNIARSSDTAKGTKKVKVEGKPVCVKDSNFSTSTGDEAGTAGGGVASSKTKGKAEFVNFSFDVQFEGKNVPRTFDLMLHNDKNTPPAPLLQGPVVALAKSGEEPKCLICGQKTSAPAAGPAGAAPADAPPSDQELSGAQWCSRYPGSSSLDDLNAPFKDDLKAFLDACKAAGVVWHVTQTYRPPQRAYLMHYAWKVAKGQVAPTAVPAYSGEGEAPKIKWEHEKKEASIKAAQAMVNGYGIVFAPALESNHSGKTAVDMSVSSWTWKEGKYIEIQEKGKTEKRRIEKNDLRTQEATIGGKKQAISTGLGDEYNTDLHAVGATYGVKKLFTDKPHWSATGG